LRGSFDYDVPLVDVGFVAEADLNSWERRVCGFIELLHNMVVSEKKQAVGCNQLLRTFVILFPPAPAMMTLVWWF
jgi:hypothetical protein